MNEDHDVKRAWTFVTGFDVPLLTTEVRDEWLTIIATLSADEFQRAARTARVDRPVKDRHLRPSPQAFLGYASTGTTRDHQAEYDRTQRFLAEQRAVVSSSQEHVAGVLARARATLGVTRKEQTTAQPVTDEALVTLRKRLGSWTADECASVLSRLDLTTLDAACFDRSQTAFRRYIEIATDGDEESQESIDAWRALAGALDSERVS